MISFSIVVPMYNLEKFPPDFLTQMSLKKVVITQLTPNHSLLTDLKIGLKSLITLPLLFGESIIEPRFVAIPSAGHLHLLDD